MYVVSVDEQWITNACWHYLFKMLWDANASFLIILVDFRGFSTKHPEVLRHWTYHRFTHYPLRTDKHVWVDLSDHPPFHPAKFPHLCRWSTRGKSWDVGDVFLEKTPGRIHESSGWWQLKYVLFLSLFGEMIQFDQYLFHPYLGKWFNLTNIFKMGWNHQLVIHLLAWFFGYVTDFCLIYIILHVFFHVPYDRFFGTYPHCKYLLMHFQEVWSQASRHLRS